MAFEKQGMSFEKRGTPQPMNIVNKCSCGNEATLMINGEMYCDECADNDNIEMTSKNE